MVEVTKTDNVVIQTLINVVTFLIFAVAHIAKSIVLALLPKAYLPRKKIVGENVLITGGGSGIGRLLALRIAKLKANVIIWDINSQGVEETVKLVEGVGGRAYGFICNIANRHDVYRVAEKTVQEVGQITILINNAGVASGKLLMETPDDLIQKTFDVNVLAHFWTTKAFLPKMVENNHGHIVTIASMAAYVGTPKLVDYCASKAAAVGFDEALRSELEKQGVTGVKTTVVSPFFIQSTGMFDDVRSHILPRLKSNEVADRIIEGLRREEVWVLIPEYLRFIIPLKWIFPWPVVATILKGLVPDAAPVTQQAPILCKPAILSDNPKGMNNSEATLYQSVGVGEKTLT